MVAVDTLKVSPAAAALAARSLTTNICRYSSVMGEFSNSDWLRVLQLDEPRLRMHEIYEHIVQRIPKLDIKSSHHVNLNPAIEPHG